MIKACPGHSLRAQYFGKNDIAHTGPILWNAIIAQDKDFADTNYKDLAKKIRSIDISKELTFKETSVILDVQILLIIYRGF